jgi:hypothetical protein
MVHFLNNRDEIFTFQFFLRIFFYFLGFTVNNKLGNYLKFVTNMKILDFLNSDRLEIYSYFSTFVVDKYIPPYLY